MDFLELIERRLETAIQEHISPGFVFRIVRTNGTRSFLPIGNYTYDDNSSPVKAESIFDVASVTKSIPTASLVLKLIDDGHLHTEDQLITFVPEFANSMRENVLIKHLLTYTVDFQLRLSTNKDKSPQEILNLILTSEFGLPPGDKFFYHNSSALLLGLVVERITGVSLDELAETVFFSPLGMNHSSFHPENFEKDLIVPTEHDEWRGKLVHGEVHDESAFALKPLMQTGHAGLFSTAPDLLTFMEMLLYEGELHGTRYFNPERITDMYTNQWPEKDFKHGLGWAIDREDLVGKLAGHRSFHKTGFTGCIVVADMDLELAYVLLSNRVYPKRADNQAAINKVREDIGNIIANQA